jgi:hypothetical protein
VFHKILKGVGVAIGGVNAHFVDSCVLEISIFRKTLTHEQAHRCASWAHRILVACMHKRATVLRVVGARPTSNDMRASACAAGIHAVLL